MEFFQHIPVHRFFKPAYQLFGTLPTHLPAKRSAALPALRAAGFFFISFYFLPVCALLIALLPLPAFTPPSSSYSVVLALFSLSVRSSKGELHSLYINFIDEPPPPPTPPQPPQNPGAGGRASALFQRWLRGAGAKPLMVGEWPATGSAPSANNL